MGRVKRESYNEKLLNSVNYCNQGSVKSAIRRLIQLEGLARRGDTVAASIAIDLKNSIGIYGGELLAVLTPRQRRIIIDVLVNDKAQADVADKLGISQQGISCSLNAGLRRIVKFLNTGRIPWRRVTDEEKDFLLENYGKTPLYRIAQQLQRSEQNCREIFKNLQEESIFDGAE